jgi:hypothetical protein
LIPRQTISKFYKIAIFSVHPLDGYLLAHDLFLNKDVPSLGLDIMAATLTWLIFIFVKLITFLRNTVQTQIFNTGTHHYEHMDTHPTSMSTSERLSQLDLKIHEVGHQEHLAVDGDIASH